MAAWVDLGVFKSFVGNTNTNDELALQAAINLGCEKVDELCGPTLTTSVTEVVRGGGYELPLRARAESITSVAKWPSGTALTAADFYADGQQIARKDGDWIDSDLTVVYTAGAATAPPWAVSAACLIGQQWFKSRLKPMASDATPVGFLVPKQAQEFMEKHLLAPDGLA